MKIFSTLFPIEERATLDDLLEVSKIWIEGSPHSPFETNDLKELREHNTTISKKNYTYGLARIDSDEEKLLGIEYSHPGKNNDCWTTQIVGNKTPNKFIISINQTYESHKATDRIHIPKKPYIIKQLLDKIGGGKDGDLETSNQPIIFKEEEGVERFVSDILTGNTNSELPIVYVSRDRNNHCLVNAMNLAYGFSGIAHVLIEPSREFSFKLKEEMGSENVYGGAVGIYWTEGTGRKVWFPENEIEKSEIEMKITNDIIEAVKSKMIPRKYTLEHIKSLHNRMLMEKLKGKKGELTEITKLFELASSELETNENQLKRAEERIYNLECKIRAISRPKSFSEGIISDPQISELYDGEIRTVILETLNETYKHLPPDIRRREVLKEIINSNKIPETKKKIIEKLRKALDGYRTITPKIKKELAAIGLSLDDGKHYKVYMTENPNGAAGTLAKTPSDVRAGRNDTKQLTDKFF